MRIMVTGTAGFIGSHLAIKLLERGDEVIGIDNLNDYYDVNLKLSRLARIKDYSGFIDVRLDIADRTGIDAAFKRYQPQKVVNLAAQAASGIRWKIRTPISIAISSGLSIFWKGADTTTSSIWFTPPVVRFTVPMNRCRFRYMTMSTIR